MGNSMTYISNHIDSKEGRFEYALNFLLNNEGGYSDDPDDPGGQTNMGITENDLKTYGKRLGFPENVKELTRYHAKLFYRIAWWDKYNYNSINSLDLATKVFDLSVNMGAIHSHILLQRAINWSGYAIPIDGVLGRRTLRAANEITFVGKEPDLHQEIREEAEHFYKKLTEKNLKLKKFLKGWLKRADE